MNWHTQAYGSKRRLSETCVVYRLLLTLLFVMLGRAAVAETLDEATVADAQCVVVGVRFSSMSDQSKRSSGQILMIYFLGRIEGRSPKVALEALVEHEANKMTASKFEESVRRCGTELTVQGEKISRIGKNLGTFAK